MECNDEEYFLGMDSDHDEDAIDSDDEAYYEKLLKSMPIFSQYEIQQKSSHLKSQQEWDSICYVSGVGDVYGILSTQT